MRLYQGNSLTNSATETNTMQYGTLRNSLLEKVVSAATVNSFKGQLGRFWANEEIYYNYKADIACIRSRSNYDVDLE